MAIAVAARARAEGPGVGAALAVLPAHVSLVGVAIAAAIVAATRQGEAVQCEECGRRICVIWRTDSVGRTGASQLVLAARLSPLLLPCGSHQRRPSAFLPEGQL